jgi:PTS system nitrogen regulatory IIA component
MSSEFISEREASEYTGLPVEKIISIYTQKKIPGAEIIKGRYCFFRKDIEKITKIKNTGTSVSISKEDSLLEDVISVQRIIIKEQAEKSPILKELSELLADSPVRCRKDIIEENIFKREALMSTGMGLGIAIPHTRIQEASDMAVSAAVVKEGISDYGAIDGQKVHLLFMIVGRTDQHDLHLRIVSKLSMKLQQKNCFSRLCSVSSSEEFYNIITE